MVWAPGGGCPGFSAAVPGAHLKDSKLLLLWSVFTKASHATINWRRQEVGILRCVDRSGPVTIPEYLHERPVS